MMSLCVDPSSQMLSHGKKGLMIIRTDYFIDAVEANDKERVEDLLKKDIEKFRLHSSHGRCVPRSHYARSLGAPVVCVDLRRESWSSLTMWLGFEMRD